MSNPPRRNRIPRPGRQALNRGTVPVSQSQLREMFANERILERAQNGELTEVVISQNPPDELYHQEAGTISQIVDYRDREGNSVAQAHRYLKLDGTLGGSGMPDPKRIYIDGTIYRIGG